VAYDNNQIIGRQYRVEIGENTHQRHHQDNIIHASSSVLRSTGKGYLKAKYDHFYQESNEIHRIHRFNFISNRMDVIIKDCVKHNAYQ
jgi:hypothetical protein